MQLQLFSQAIECIDINCNLYILILFIIQMLREELVLRPPTIPTKRQRKNLLSSENSQKQKIRDLEVVKRPQEIFFKVIFERDNYIWVIFHKNIMNNNTMQIIDLYNRMKAAYQSLKRPDYDSLPIFTNYHQFQVWSENWPKSNEYKVQCKVVVDQSIIVDTTSDDFEKICKDPSAVLFRVVTEKNIEVVRRVKKNRQFYDRIKGLDDNYDIILQMIKEDTQKLRINQKKELEIKRLPNFMKLTIKDKSNLINYRSNIYCLMNLHNHVNDMEVSKARFIEQCQKQYVLEKQKQFIRYYLNYPFGEREILRAYTDENFFYKCMNNTLRVAKSTEDFFIIGEPFNRMFHAIKKLYQDQFPIANPRNFKVYRGADLSPTECQYLENCIGSYIEIQGFVSTSTKLSEAKKFATMGNHNKILQIQFQDNRDCDAKILENDYGFVNLVDISKYEEEQILFNSLNVFKVLRKEEKDGFVHYILKYGTIFKILQEKNPDQLDQNDRYAYYTYKELIGEKANLGDLGQVFLKGNQTQKSVDYYETKLIEAEKNNSRHQNQDEVQQLKIKKAQALIENGEPEAALRELQNIINGRQSFISEYHKPSDKLFENMQKLQKIKAQPMDLNSISMHNRIMSHQGDQLNKQTNEMNRQVNDKIRLSLSAPSNITEEKIELILTEINLRQKTCAIDTNLDKFEQAEKQLEITSKAIQKVLKKDSWDFDLAFSQVEVKMQMAQLKETLGFYQEERKILEESEHLIELILAKIQNQDISFLNKRKVYLQKTLIYQQIAKISINFEGENKIDIDELEQKYLKTEDEIKEFIEQSSYDKSLVQIRKSQIERRKEDFKKQKKSIIEKLQKSLIEIKITASKDEQIPKTLHIMADIQKQSKNLQGTTSAIVYLEKAYVVQSVYYGENDPRTYATKIQIAQSHREKKDPQQSIQILKDHIAKISPYKTKDKHTIVAKSYYTMGLSYLDIGEFSHALHIFLKAMNILQEILSKIDLERSTQKYKLHLQIGRAYTMLVRYPEAEENLLVYKTFALQLYKEHSEVANSYNQLAILYLKKKDYKVAQENFVKSQEIYQRACGEKSLFCAQINCNLGMISAYNFQREKALKHIEKAQFLFNEIYLQNKKDMVHTQSYKIEFYKGQIYRMFQQYEAAIDYFQSSIDKEKEFKAIKEDVVKMSSLQFTSYKSSKFYQAKSKIQAKENNQYICTIKIFQCQTALLNDNKNKISLEKTNEKVFKLIAEVEKLKKILEAQFALTEDYLNEAPIPPRQDQKNKEAEVDMEKLIRKEIQKELQKQFQKEKEKAPRKTGSSEKKRMILECEAILKKLKKIGDGKKIRVSSIPKKKQ